VCVCVCVCLCVCVCVSANPSRAASSIEIFKAETFFQRQTL
jgi:hypothetical protein